MPQTPQQTSTQGHLYARVSDALRTNDAATVTALVQDSVDLEFAYEMIADEDVIHLAGTDACTALCVELLKRSQQLHDVTGAVLFVGAVSLSSALNAEQLCGLAEALDGHVDSTTAGEYRACLWISERADVRVLSRCLASEAARLVKNSARAAQQLDSLYGPGFCELLDVYAESRRNSCSRITLEELVRSVANVKHALDMVTLLCSQSDMLVQDAVERVAALPRTGATVAGRLGRSLATPLSSAELLSLAEALS